MSSARVCARVCVCVHSVGVESRRQAVPVAGEKLGEEYCGGGLRALHSHLRDVNKKWWSLAQVFPSRMIAPPTRDQEQSATRAL